VHPKVADAAVVAGEALHAVVLTAAGVPGGASLERELRAYLRSRVAPGRMPRSIDFSAGIPRTASGKLVRRRIASRFALSDTVLV
jgi:acyl-coenzyme A synthetase/AMP-(fatty) acid ligase